VRSSDAFFTARCFLFTRVKKSGARRGIFFGNFFLCAQLDAPHFEFLQLVQLLIFYQQTLSAKKHKRRKGDLSTDFPAAGKTAIKSASIKRWGNATLRLSSKSIQHKHIYIHAE
jgi:hypothetical protein